LFDGSGFDLNVAGFTVGDGVTYYVDGYKKTVIASGAIIPAGAAIYQFGEAA
jgi:hypothetical protein